LLPAETPTGGKTIDWIRLEKLKGGLHAKRKVLRNRKKRAKIAAVLRERAGYLDEVVRILESYSAQAKPAIMKLAAAHARTPVKYRRYKSIQYHMSTVELPDGLKIACINQGLAFAAFHDEHKPKLLDRHAPYTEFAFASDYFGGMGYLIGGQVDSLDTLPERLLAMDTGLRRFAVITFRSRSMKALVGGPEGPGKGMKDAGSYIEKHWMPKHKGEVIHMPKPGICEVNHNGHVYQLGTIEMYNRDVELDPEMSIYIPLQPESYSPKAKPEIVKLAGEISMSKAYTVKRERSGAYISDIPRLKWGQWKDDTYSGALSLLLQIAGEDVTYEQVMGWSGSCYRICQKDDLCPSGALPQIGWVDSDNVDNAAGRRRYASKRRGKRTRMLADSIRQGVPVLCGKPRVEDEYGILCGYRKKPFGKLVPYGRSYFDYEPPARDKIFTGDRYFHADMYPGWQLDFYAKKGEPIPPRQALKASLEACIKIYTQEPAEWAVPFGYQYGDAAYAIWIDKLAHPDGINEYDGKLHHHFRALVDARRAASVYLRQSCPLLRGANQERLAKVAGLYDEMTQALLRVRDYETAECVMFVIAERLPWTEADRASLAETLQQIRAWETQARAIVQEILAQWEEA